MSKKRERAKWGSIMSFRHGENLTNPDGTRRSIYVPGRSPTAIYPKGQSRTALVERVTDQLAGWTTTPFQFEGAVRAGLRSGLCLADHGWQASDDEAAGLVTEALRGMGAERPTWEQGQRGYAEPHDFCEWCGGAMDDEERTRGQRFCCAEHAKAGLAHMARKDRRNFGRALESARRMVKRSDAEPRICAQCGTSFQPGRPHQVYCSQSCSAKATNAAVASSLGQLTCDCCCETFSPKNAAQRFCSERCAKRVENARTRIRNGNARLSAICFDIVFTFPANERAATWLNAERLDRLLEGA